MKKILFFAFLLCSTILMNAQWVMQTAPTFTAANGASISAPTDQICWAGGDAASVLRTTDGGTTWVKVAASGLTGDVANIFAIDANTAFVTTTPAATFVYKTTDGGATFTQVFTQSGGFIDVIYFFSATQGIIIGDPVGARWTIFTTTNGGTTWDSTGHYLPQVGSEAGWNNAYFSTDNAIAFGTNNSKVYVSTNSGASFTGWPTTGVTNTFGIWFNNQNLGLVVGGAGIKTTNGGTSWTAFTLQGTTGNVYSVVGSGSNFMYPRGLVVYNSTDEGTTWATQFTVTGSTSTILDLVKSRVGVCGWLVTGDGKIAKGTSIGLPVELSAFTANVNKNNVNLSWNTKSEVNNRGFEVERKIEGGQFQTLGFVNGNGTSTETHSYNFTDSKLAQGKYTYRLKQLDFNGNYEFSNAVEVNVVNPGSFALLQNYPNPFNPSTVITFNVPEAGNVKLSVYNMLGQQVASLVNGYKEAGTYKVEFNAKNLTSGAYFYKLEAGKFNQTMKMLLSK